MQALTPSPSSAAALPGRAPMCGGPNDDDSDSEDIRARYWGDTISWNYNMSALERSGNITWEDILYDTRSAMRFWSSNGNLRFVYRPDIPNADITIGFYKGYHASCKTPFDGIGNMLAHAYHPGPGRGGDIHLDADEFWVEHSDYLPIAESHDVRDMGGTSVISLYATLLHEIGHSLGFKHNEVVNSVMGENLTATRKGYTMSYYDRILLWLVYGKPDKLADDRFVAKDETPTSPLITTPPPPPPSTTTSTTTTTTSPSISTSQTPVSSAEDEPNESRFAKRNDDDDDDDDDDDENDNDDDDGDDGDEKDDSDDGDEDGNDDDDDDDENDADRSDDAEKGEEATPTPETPPSQPSQPTTTTTTASPRFVAPKKRMHFLADKSTRNATNTLRSVLVNGYVMMFDNGYVWHCVLREDGAIVKTDPQYIEKEFHIQYTRLRSIDHVYSPFAGMINMIDRDNLWRFYEQRIVPGYPKSLVSLGLPRELPYGTRFMPDSTRHLTYIQIPNNGGLYVFDEDRNMVRASIF